MIVRCRAAPTAVPTAALRPLRFAGSSGRVLIHTRLDINCRNVVRTALLCGQ